MLPLARRYNMGQPVKLSDELVDDAGAVVPFSKRSIAGQIEFWAGLGKSIEPLLRGDQALALHRCLEESGRYRYSCRRWKLPKVANDLRLLSRNVPSHHVQMYANTIRE